MFLRNPSFYLAIDGLPQGRFGFYRRYLRNAGFAAMTLESILNYNSVLIGLRGAIDSCL
jgi:hypothetical protein